MTVAVECGMFSLYCVDNCLCGVHSKLCNVLRIHAFYRWRRPCDAGCAVLVFVDDCFVEIHTPWVLDPPPVCLCNLYHEPGESVAGVRALRKCGKRQDFR